MTLSLPTEYEEQCVLVDYLELRGFKFSKIAQETFTKSWGIKLKNKRSGLRPGLPDMVCIVGKTLIFVELKRVKKGVVSKEQAEWIEAINQCDNIYAVVCKGAEQAIKEITHYEAMEGIKKN